MNVFVVTRSDRLILTWTNYHWPRDIISRGAGRSWGHQLSGDHRMFITSYIVERTQVCNSRTFPLLASRFLRDIAFVVLPVNHIPNSVESSQDSLRGIET